VVASWNGARDSELRAQPCSALPRYLGPLVAAGVRAAALCRIAR
jgi:hypothetical protein